MDIRRILILVFVVLTLTSCLAEKSSEITAAEVQATQQAIERRNQLDEKVFEIKMAMAWPTKVLTIGLLFAFSGFIIISGHRLIDHWLWERQMKVEESMARLKRVEVKKEERKLNPPTGGTNVQPPPGTGDWPNRNQPIISSAGETEFNDIIKIAETKLK